MESEAEETRLGEAAAPPPSSPSTELQRITAGLPPDGRSAEATVTTLRTAVLAMLAALEDMGYGLFQYEAHRRDPLAQAHRTAAAGGEGLRRVSTEIPSAAEIRAIVEEVVRKVLAERPKAPEPDLTTEQVAVVLGLAEKTVRKYARQGLIRGTRHGQEWRFTRAAVDTYRAGGTHGPAAVAGKILASLGKG